MNFIKKWIEKRNNRKEFEKIFDGIAKAMKEMMLFEPNERKTHEHAEIITKNMLLANGCNNVNVFIYAFPEGSSTAKAKINLIYHGESYSIDWQANIKEK